MYGSKRTHSRSANVLSTSIKSIHLLRCRGVIFRCKGVIFRCREMSFRFRGAIFRCREVGFRGRQVRFRCTRPSARRAGLRTSCPRALNLLETRNTAPSYKNRTVLWERETPYEIHRKR